MSHEVGQRDVFVLSDESSPAANYPGSDVILTRAGITVHRCDATPDQFDCFPWVGVERAVVVAPFVVDVRWGFVAAPLAGYGGRTRFLTFFGVVVPLGDWVAWAT